MIFHVIIVQQSRSPYDLYKTVLDLTVQRPRLQLRTNIDYKDRKATINTVAARRRMTWWKRFKLLVGKASRLGQSSTEEQRDRANADERQAAHRRQQGRWHGLSRYQVENIPSIRRALLFEQYAKVTSILNSGQMELSYYTDYAGRHGSAGVVIDELGANTIRSTQDLYPSQQSSLLKIYAEPYRTLPTCSRSGESI